VNNVYGSSPHHNNPLPSNTDSSSLALYAPTTSAASSYLHHSLTIGLQEKVAAEEFEPVTKGLTVPCVKQQLRNTASSYPQT
jgi:hypothetical protein